MHTRVVTAVLNGVLKDFPLSIQDVLEARYSGSENVFDVGRKFGRGHDAAATRARPDLFFSGAAWSNAGTAVPDKSANVSPYQSRSVRADTTQSPERWVVEGSQWCELLMCTHSSGDWVFDGAYGRIVNGMDPDFSDRSCSISTARSLHQTDPGVLTRMSLLHHVLCQFCIKHPTRWNANIPFKHPPCRLFWSTKAGKTLQYSSVIEQHPRDIRQFKAQNSSPPLATA